ncbi:MAG: hypothetical protein Q9212_006311 [Teloschistes hypoglaucus]
MKSFEKKKDHSHRNRRERRRKRYRGRRQGCRRERRREHRRQSDGHAKQRQIDEHRAHGIRIRREVVQRRLVLPEAILRTAGGERQVSHPAAARGREAEVGDAAVLDALAEGTLVEADVDGSAIIRPAHHGECLAVREDYIGAVRPGAISDV